MFDGIAAPVATELTLYTDALIIRGTIQTRHRRITDVLNLAEFPFLVLDDVSIDEYGSPGTPMTAPYAQVNLDTVLFAIADMPVDSNPMMRVMKAHEQALITIPPFSVTGTIHLPPTEGDIREGLRELTDTFIPVTGVAFWSESLREARRQAAFVAVNHRRVQFISPHRQTDLWAGLDQVRPVDEAVQLEPAED